MQTTLFIMRRERGLSQKEVAQMLNIHPNTYYKKERGKSDFELKEAFYLAHFFETTVDELFKKEEAK